MYFVNIPRLIFLSFDCLLIDFVIETQSVMPMLELFYKTQTNCDNNNNNNTNNNSNNNKNNNNNNSNNNKNNNNNNNSSRIIKQKS